jgi:hypothetical protein
MSKDQEELFGTLKQVVKQTKINIIDEIADRTTRQDLDALLTVMNNYVDLKLTQEKQTP